MLVLIVFSGAGVRLTGSGLGCPDWPRCGGTFTPELSTHVAIEYGNRLLSALVGVSCVAAGLLVFRVRPFRPELVWPALVIAFGVVAQGLLGAATVLLDLKWQVVIAHYLLSMVLLTAAGVLVWRAMRWTGTARDRPVTLAARVLVALGGAVIVAGTLATAAGPHAGGAGTGDVVERLDAFGATTLKTLIYVHGHAAAVLGGVAVLVWLFAWRRGASRPLMLSLTAVCVLMAVQGTVGLIQYHNALPAEVVWVHASLPAVMWVTLVWSWTAAGRLEPAVAAEPARVHAGVPTG
jgi:cytochrome c oxidase assembly protein subunit 15